MQIHLATMPDAVFGFGDVLDDNVIGATDIAIKLLVTNAETGQRFCLS